MELSRSGWRLIAFVRGIYAGIHQVDVVSWKWNELCIFVGLVTQTITED